MSLSDAVAFIVGHLKAGTTGYGYDLHVDQLANSLLQQKSQSGGFIPPGQPGSHDDLRGKTRILYDAAWHLVQIGVLRLGVRYQGLQEVDGLGLSLTPFGQNWVGSAEDDTFSLSDGDTLRTKFTAHAAKFGFGYLQRAHEAVHCFHAQAYLACCSMCGASAESILLALAIAKTGDETKTLKEYASAQGRQATLNKLIGQSDATIKRTITAFLGLLTFWRDESAHGLKSDIGPDEASIALIELLRFAIVADKRWAELTAS